MKTVYVVAVIVGEEIDVEATFSTHALALDFVQKRDAKGFRICTWDIFESVIDECIDCHPAPVYEVGINDEGPHTRILEKMVGTEPYEEVRVYGSGYVSAMSSISEAYALELAESARKEDQAASAD